MSRMIGRENDAVVPIVTVARCELLLLELLVLAVVVNVCLVLLGGRRTY